MGGFGTFTYAARHPDLFTAALSMSGAVDTTLVPGVIDAISGSDGGPPGSLWGPFETQAVRWRAHNPLDLAENLRGLALWLRTGNGQPGGPLGGSQTVDIIEAGVEGMAKNVHRRLLQLRHPERARRLRPGPAHLAVLESRPGGDPAGDHGPLPPGLEAAGARDLQGGRAALLGVRVEREHQAPGAGVQHARQRRPARLHALGQRQRNRHDRAAVRAWPRLPGRGAHASEASCRARGPRTPAVACASPCGSVPETRSSSSRPPRTRGCSRRA